MIPVPPTPLRRRRPSPRDQIAPGRGSRATHQPGRPASPAATARRARREPATLVSWRSRKRSRLIFADLAFDFQTDASKTSPSCLRKQPRSAPPRARPREVVRRRVRPCRPLRDSQSFESRCRLPPQTSYLATPANVESLQTRTSPSVVSPRTCSSPTTSATRSVRTTRASSSVS